MDINILNEAILSLYEGRYEFGNHIDKPVAVYNFELHEDTYDYSNPTEKRYTPEDVYNAEDKFHTFIDTINLKEDILEYTLFDATDDTWSVAIGNKKTGEIWEWGARAYKDISLSEYCKRIIDIYRGITEYTKKYKLDL